jgi:hypothetical protein
MGREMLSAAKHDSAVTRTDSWINLLNCIIGGVHDDEVSKINTDDEPSLYAAMSSFIIHIYF